MLNIMDAKYKGFTVDNFRHTAYNVNTYLNTFLIMHLFMHFKYELVILETKM